MAYFNLYTFRSRLEEQLILDRRSVPLFRKWSNQLGPMHTLQSWGRVKLWCHLTLTSFRDGGEWMASGSGRLTSGKCPGAHRKQGWKGRRQAETNFSCMPGIESRFLGCLVRRAVTTPTVLCIISRLLTQNNFVFILSHVISWFTAVPICIQTVVSVCSYYYDFSLTW